MTNTELDAARYRWLRNHGNPDNHGRPYVGAECLSEGWGKWFTKWLGGRILDRAVDRAMREKTENK